MDMIVKRSIDSMKKFEEIRENTKKYTSIFNNMDEISLEKYHINFSARNFFSKIDVELPILVQYLNENSYFTNQNDIILSIQDVCLFIEYLPSNLFKEVFNKLLTLKIFPKILNDLDLNKLSDKYSGLTQYELNKLICNLVIKNMDQYVALTNIYYGYHDPDAIVEFYNYYSDFVNTCHQYFALDFASKKFHDWRIADHLNKEIYELIYGTQFTCKDLIDFIFTKMCKYTFIDSCSYDFHNNQIKEISSLFDLLLIKHTSSLTLANLYTEIAEDTKEPYEHIKLYRYILNVLKLRNKEVTVNLMINKY